MLILYIVRVNFSFFVRYSFQFGITIIYMMKLGNLVRIVNKVKTSSRESLHNDQSKISFLMKTLIHALFHLDLKVLFINHSVLCTNIYFHGKKWVKQGILSVKPKRGKSFKNSNIYRAIIIFYNQINYGIGVLFINLIIWDYNR